MSTVEGWCHQNGRTSKASSCCGGTRFASTMLFGEPGICNVRLIMKHAYCLEMWKHRSLLISVCNACLSWRCREETEPCLPFCHTFGWQYGFRSTSTNRGEHVWSVFDCRYFTPEGIKHVFSFEECELFISWVRSLSLVPCSSVS